MRVAQRVMLALGTAALLSSCGGGTAPSAPIANQIVVVQSPGSSSGSASTPTPTPTPSPSPSTVTGLYYSAQAGQDMSIVGSRLWVFDKSDSNHKASTGWILDPYSLAKIGTFTQNISHAATADYQPDVDTMVLGNAGDTGAAAPRIDLFPHFSRYGTGSFIDWSNAISTPRISIPLVAYAPDGKTVLRAALPTNDANAVWIDRRTVIVFAGSGSFFLRAAQVRLGMGGEDLSGAGFGTFLPGKSADEFNGTAQLIASYTSSLRGTTQGATYKGDRLYLGWTAGSSSQHALNVLQLALTSGGTIEQTGAWSYLPTNADGTTRPIETEGVTFRGNDLMVSGRNINDGQQAIYVFINPKL